VVGAAQAESAGSCDLQWEVVGLSPRYVAGGLHRDRLGRDDARPEHLAFDDLAQPHRVHVPAFASRYSKGPPRATPSTSGREPRSATMENNASGTVRARAAATYVALTRLGAS